jgi:hypothetical protein
MIGNSAVVSAWCVFQWPGVNGWDRTPLRVFVIVHVTSAPRGRPAVLLHSTL